MQGHPVPWVPALACGLVLGCGGSGTSDVGTVLDSMVDVGPMDVQVDVAVAEDVTVVTAQVDIPYLQDFNGSSALNLVLWTILDYGTAAASHWSVEPDGALGLDEHVQFSGSPALGGVKSVAATPIIDASSAQGGGNPEQATTIQWRMSYQELEFTARSSP